MPENRHCRRSMGTHPHIPRSPGMTTPRAPHPGHTPTHADCGGCLFPPALPEPAATPAPQRTPTHPARTRARFRRSGQPRTRNPARGLPSVHRLQRVRTPARAHGAEWYRNSCIKPSARAPRGALIGSAAAPPSRAGFPRAKNTPRARTDKNLKNINLPKGYFLT